MSKVKPGLLRKDWLAIKKKYPEFEKNKNFKADLGPILDSLEKHALVLDKAAATLSAELAAVQKLTLQAATILDAYARFVPSNMITDFTKFARPVMVLSNEMTTTVKEWNKFKDASL